MVKDGCTYGAAPFRKPPSLSLRSAAFLVWHSQTTSTAHPASRSASWLVASRSVLRRSLGPSRIQALELTEKYQAFLGG